MQDHRPATGRVNLNETRCNNGIKSSERAISDYQRVLRDGALFVTPIRIYLRVEIEIESR